MGEYHFFSSDAFLRLLADLRFPGARPMVVSCEDVVVRALVLRGRAISEVWNLPISLRPIDDPGVHPAIEVPYLAHVVRRVTGASDPAPRGVIAAPFIRWGEFATWEDYERHATASLGARSISLRRDESRLAREVGPVQFNPEDDAEDAFDAAIRWKVAQLRRNGRDPYPVEHGRDLYQEMRRRGMLTVSSVRAGGRLAATALVTRWGGSYLFRLTAYDPELATFSPGAIHLDYLLRASYAAGDEEFDFLMGSEGYKLRYATHVRWISPVGREPRLDRFRRQGRTYAGRLARHYPAVHNGLRRAEATSTRLLQRMRLS